MPELLDLPNEILRNILECASEVDHDTLFNVTTVNKRLNSVVDPLLVRSWTGEWDSNPELFLLHLLRHPEYRREIRHLDLHPSIETRHEGFESNISDTELEELAAVAAEAWPELSESTGFLEHLRQGVHDAFLIVLLTWAKNLTSLCITIPHFDPADQEDLLTLRWVSQVAWRINWLDQTAPDQLPLMKLEQVHFAHWDTENFVEHRLAAPFFHLPRVKSFSSHLMGTFVPWDDGDHTEQENLWSQVYSGYLTTFPVGTSSVTSLQLGQTDLSPDGLSDVILACRSLTSLTWELVSFHTEMPSSNKIASLLMHHAKSLKMLTLESLESSDFEAPDDNSDGGPTLEACFQHLECLEELAVPWNLLRGQWTDSDDDETHYSELPPSIAFLQPQSYNNGTREEMNKVIGQLEGMMEQYPSLKELNLSRILRKDDKNERLTRFRSSLAEKGVEAGWKRYEHLRSRV